MHLGNNATKQEYRKKKNVILKSMTMSLLDKPKEKATKKAQASSTIFFFFPIFLAAAFARLPMVSVW